ncbi:MAG TPA: hypothetical protein VFA07_03710 [Chthonomonadaceae bacterium]|nr:hypothetical protein [Chthonomonadaceae bacterium]
MLNLLMHLFGKRVVHRAVASHARGGGLLDVRFGFALFRDRRIPLGGKLLALILGGLLTALLVSLEIPLEGLLTLLLPFLAVPDFVVDGMETVLGPFVLGALLLPFLAPRPLVDQIRDERAGVIPGTFIPMDNGAQTAPPYP